MYHFNMVYTDLFWFRDFIAYSNFCDSSTQKGKMNANMEVKKHCI